LTDKEKGTEPKPVKVKWVSDKSQIVTIEETLAKLDEKKDKEH
jgi:hypothetical protein